MQTRKTQDSINDIIILIVVLYLNQAELPSVTCSCSSSFYVYVLFWFRKILGSSKKVQLIIKLIFQHCLLLLCSVLLGPKSSLVVLHYVDNPHVCN